MGKCNKSLKLMVPHRAFLPGMSLRHSAPPLGGTPLTPFYPKAIIPVFAPERKRKVEIYSLFTTFLALG